MRHMKNHRGMTMPSRQRGVVLLITLIVLVAMTLAAIGMMRSVDTGMVVAGNMGFKQSTLQGADSGYGTAMAALKNMHDTNMAALQNNGAFAGYVAEVCDLDTVNPCAATPWWSDATDWSGDPYFWTGALTNWDAAPSVTLANGVTVQYVVHRMCPNQGLATLTNQGGGTDGCMMEQIPTGHDINDPLLEMVYYRITTRSVGPRNSISYTQTLALLLN